MRLSITLAALTLSAFTAGATLANTVHFDFYVDDRATVMIDGNPFGSYNNPFAAGNVVGDLNLASGWHDISIQYANQSGTNFLAFRWSFPGDPNLSDVPLVDLRSLDQNAQYISGLHADYYASWGGNYITTVLGEGPIDNGALSFTLEKYQGVTGPLWAGMFGPSAQFSEVLNGQFFVPAQAPEPSSTLPAAGALLVLIGSRRGTFLRKQASRI